jgi:hypothetical protein
MGSIDSTGFDIAINSGTQTGNPEVEYRTDGGGLFPIVNTNQISNNPTSDESPLFINQGGSQLPSGVGFTDIVASQETSIGSVIVRLNDPNGGKQRLFTIDQDTPGSGFPESVPLGAEVRIDFGYIELGSNGLAKAVAQSLQSYKYELTNGSGTVYKTITPSDGAHVPIQYNGGSLPKQFQIGSNLQFSNNSGSEWSNVQQINVRDTNSEELLFSDSGFSAIVPDNGSVTFTTLRLEVSF